MGDCSPRARIPDQAVAWRVVHGGGVRVQIRASRSRFTPLPSDEPCSVKNACAETHRTVLKGKHDDDLPLAGDL